MSEYRRILQRLRNGKPVIMDGGTGTEILRRGVGGRYDLPWAVNGLVYAPELVRRIHQDYYEKGAHIVTANTFYTTEYALAAASRTSRADFSGLAASLTYLAVYLAKDATRLSRNKGLKQEMCVAGSVGPMEVELPYERRNTPQSYIIQRENRQRIQHLIEAGVDFVLIETMTTLKEARANLDLIQNLDLQVPYWTSFSCKPDNGHLYSDESMAEVVSMLDKYSLKPDALLINCTEPDAVTKALEDIQEAGPKMALGTKPNLESRVYQGSNFYERSDSITAKSFAKLCKTWNEDFGVQILGGCCGSTPEDIEALAEILRQKI